MFERLWMVWYSRVCVTRGVSSTPHHPLGFFLNSSSACAAVEVVTGMPSASAPGICTHLSACVKLCFRDKVSTQHSHISLRAECCPFEGLQHVFTICPRHARKRNVSRLVFSRVCHMVSGALCDVMQALPLCMGHRMHLNDARSSTGEH